MSSVAPVPPPPPPGSERLGRKSRHRRSFWKKLSRRQRFRQVVSTTALWVLAVAVMWVILKQIIK